MSSNNKDIEIELMSATPDGTVTGDGTVTRGEEVLIVAKDGDGDGIPTAEVTVGGTSQSVGPAGDCRETFENTGKYDITVEEPNSGTVTTKTIEVRGDLTISANRSTVGLHQEVTFTVRNNLDEDVPDAEIHCQGRSKSTDSDGQATFKMGTEGEVTARASKENYKEDSCSVTVKSRGSLHVEPDTWTPTVDEQVTVTVTDDSDNGVSDARVSGFGDTTRTDSNGTASIGVTGDAAPIIKVERGYYETDTCELNVKPRNPGDPPPPPKGNALLLVIGVLALFAVSGAVVIPQYAGEILIFSMVISVAVLIALIWG